MRDVIISTGCLPYDDGSGFAIHIEIVRANEYFKNERVILNPDSEFTDFNIADWPEVRAAIGAAINAREQLPDKETP